MLVAISLFAGYYYNQKNKSGKSGYDGRKVLYYVDPMNPGFKSDKPGVAPCGMPMEPVYADGGTAGKDAENLLASMSTGSVRISPEKQQMIGVRTEMVERKPTMHTLRILGRVASDENRLFRINTSTEVWIRKVYPPTTGSIVRKDEPLLAYYSPNFLTAAQAYLYALDTVDRLKSAKQDTPEQLSVTNAQVRLAVESLQNLGVSDLQIEELAKSRKISDAVIVRSPTDGFLLSRTATQGQWAAIGTELYLIADLSRIWIFADLYENEARYLRPGIKVKVTYTQLEKTFEAKVSGVLPFFDPASRTLRVRLEAVNPGYILRPGMFVDVELPVKFSPAIVLPADAVLDSGLKKTVFVDRGNGFFEQRTVETGWRREGQVEIIKGLTPGEKIVVSGNFFLDSESKLKAAATGIRGKVSRDSICGMDVDEVRAKAMGMISEYRGKTYYFCSDDCKQKFDKNPSLYLKKTGGSKGPRDTTGMKDMQALDAATMIHNDPICGMDVDEKSARASGRISEYQGKTYFFCADSCKQQFDKEPERYIDKKVEGGGNKAHPTTSAPPHD